MESDITLKVSPEAVGDVWDRWQSEGDLGQYISQLFARLGEEQSVLSTWLAEFSPSVLDPGSYAIGAALAYDIITTQLSMERKKVDLVPTDFAVMQRNLVDSLTDNNVIPELQHYTEQGYLIINASWLMRKIDYSPEFQKLINELIGKLKRPEHKTSFILGIVNISMPFYTKVEAQRLNQTFNLDT